MKKNLSTALKTDRDKCHKLIHNIIESGDVSETVARMFAKLRNGIVEEESIEIINLLQILSNKDLAFSNLEKEPQKQLNNLVDYSRLIVGGDGN